MNTYGYMGHEERDACATVRIDAFHLSKPVILGQLAVGVESTILEVWWT